MSLNEQGVTDERYKIIPRTLIFLTRRDQILLLRGAANKRLWASKYNGVGGHVECDENVLEAARRELLEETGLIPDDLWLCGIVTVYTGPSTGIGIFVFKGECSNGEPKKSFEGDLTWVKETEYANMPLVGDLYALLPKVLSMRKDLPAFFAHTRYDELGNMNISFAS